MAENKWVSLGLFHPYKWSYLIPPYSCFFGPTGGASEALLSSMGLEKHETIWKDRPVPPKASLLEGKWDPLILGKSGSVKYYNWARWGFNMDMHLNQVIINDLTSHVLVEEDFKLRQNTNCSSSNFPSQILQPTSTQSHFHPFSPLSRYFFSV